MASKDIDKFLVEVADLGIEVCENTIRHKLKVLGLLPKDLKHPFIRGYVVNTLQEGGVKANFDNALMLWKQAEGEV